MATEWAFLEPWYAALCASFIQYHPKNSKSEMKVSFKWPFLRTYTQRQCCHTIHLKEGDPQNVIQLKTTQEAMELFTILSVINNKAFMERFPQLTHFMDKSTRCYPEWNLYVIGDPAVQQDTWSRYSELSDLSPQFQRAIQMVKAKEMGDADKRNIFSCDVIPVHAQWTCKFDGAEVNANLSHGKETDIMKEIQIDLRTLFNAGAPLIVQLGLSPKSASRGDIWQDLRQQVAMQARVCVTLRDLTTEYSRGLAAGLTRTPMKYLTIKFCKETKTSDAQAAINTGIIMNRVYDWYRVNIGFTCEKVPKSVFAAICSTIAVQSQTPISFSKGSVDSESWPWLIHAICCGAPVKLIIWDVILAKSDLLGISDVLRYNYPHSTSAALELRSKSHGAVSQFGFVDILKGTAVWPVEESGAPAFVTPSSIRCRAWFKEDSIVEVIIPGFGRCQSRLGDGVYEVSRDSEGQSAQVSGTLRTLSMTFLAIESVSVVVNLLGLIGRNLRSLALGIPSHRNNLPLDLSALSAQCPNLSSLRVRGCDVVVSVHNEALRLWPIKLLEIRDSRKLADITLCLRNPSLRMTRELKELCLEYRGQRCDEEEKRDLMTHDGDFLAETFPIQSKAALISVIDGAQCAKEIHQLHEDVLGLIFTFASTPARRLVRVVEADDEIYWR